MASRSATTRWVPLALVGLGAGFLSGLFGVGGGLLIVPGLVVVLGLEQRLAHGTSLAAIVPIAVSGAIGYALDGAVDWPVALFLTVGAAGVGAALGTHLLHVLPIRALSVVFAAVLLVTASRLVLDHADAAGRSPLTVAGSLGLVALGVLAGALAGLLGVGGGVVLVPGMVLLYGITTVVAKGTSLAVIIPTAVAGTLRNVRRGHADLRAAGVVGSSGAASAYVASKISIGLSATASNVLFAALLLVVAIRMLHEARRPGSDRPAGGDQLEL